MQGYAYTSTFSGGGRQDSEREILKYPSRLLYNLSLFLSILFAKMARGSYL